MLLHPLDGQPADLLLRQTDLFNRTNDWGIRVNVRPAGSDPALEAEIIRRDPSALPAVILAADDLIQALTAAPVGLQPLDERMADPQVGLGSGQPFDQRWLAQTRTGEGQMGLPALVTLQGFLYDQTRASELGFEAAPRTPDEFFEMACASAVMNNQYAKLSGTGGWMLDTRPATALGWLRAYNAGMDWLGGAGPWVFDTPANQSAWAELRGQQGRGCIWLSAYPSPVMYLADGRVFAFSATLQDIPLQDGLRRAQQSTHVWKFLPFPSADGEPFYLASGYSYAILGGNDDAQNLAAWLYLRWMSSPGQLTALGRSWFSLDVREGQPGLSVSRYADWLDPDALILPVPSSLAWRDVSVQLGDAFWQLFHVANAGQMEALLPGLDEAIKEME